MPSRARSTSTGGARSGTGRIVAEQMAKGEQIEFGLLPHVSPIISPLPRRPYSETKDGRPILCLAQGQ